MRIKEQIVATLRKNEVVHEAFKIGVSFGHILVNRADMKAVPFDGEQGIESLLEYLTRGEWEGLYEEDFLIGAQKDNATVLLGAGGQIEFHVAKTAHLKDIDKAYLDFLQELGSELEARDQLMLSVGYQPASKVSEIAAVPMVKAKMMEAALQDDEAALQALKGRAHTVVTLDYAHNDDFEKKYRVVHTLAPVFAALLDNIPVVDGVDYEGFVAGIAMDDNMKTALAKVDNVMSAHSFKYAQYANITGNAPAVAIEENGAIVATDKTVEEAYETVAVTDDHAIAALDMMMPEVKATANGLEVRYVDALPYPLNMAYVAMLKGLVYNVDNLNALQDFISGIAADARENLRPSAIAAGLNAPYGESTLREIAKDMYFMATPQLPEEEQHYTQPLDAIIFKEICPKDITKRQLAAMRG